MAATFAPRRAIRRAQLTRAFPCAQKTTQATIKQRTLGRTGLKVSELCLGTMNFGWKTDEQKSFAILDAYFEAGGNFIQATGHCPVPALTAASTTFSEEIVGRWWKRSNRTTRS